MSSLSLDEQMRAAHATGGLVRIKLDSTQERLWTETRSAMLVSCPMFSHILYTMLVPSRSTAVGEIAFFTDKVPIAATDGYELFLNPTPFFKLSLPQRVFVVAHEIMHCVFNHNGIMHQCKTRGKVVTLAGKSLEYIHELMNMAMDYVINDLLHESKVGDVIQGICLDKAIGTSKDSCIDVYEKLYKSCNGGKGPRFIDLSGLSSDVMDPGSGQGKDPATGASERNDQEWSTAVAAAVASAKAQGKLPSAMELAFGQVLDPVVDWTDYVKAFFARKAGAGGYDWRRPERQLIARGVGNYLEGQAIFAPGRSGYGAGTIVVGMDSSGSIHCDPSLIDRWMGELSGILNDLRPKRIIVMWCDATIQRVDEVEEASDLDVIRRKGSKGGGGTSFVPVFEEIEKMGISPIDALVYLTDGMGSFPAHAPEYPVLWGNITPNYEKNYPFGEVVTIPLQT